MINFLTTLGVYKIENGREYYRYTYAQLFFTNLSPFGVI